MTTISVEEFFRRREAGPPRTCYNPAARVSLGSTKHSMLDHALRWASRGIHVFACEEFLGSPHPDNWYKAATTDRDAIVQMWSRDPTADIAAVPEKSGHYVLIAVGDAGQESKARFEEEHGLLKPEFRYRNYFGAEHLWFRGGAFTARIDRAFHIVGPGRYVYLAAAHAPHFLCWER